ncbi:MAG: ABC transporter ATP-binding protein [Pseudomonadota bacterium]
MIEVKNLSKTFAKAQTAVLDNICFSVQDGEYISLTGRSGSGKTTLLYCISSLDAPSSGEVIIDGQDINQKTEAELHHFRNRDIGFIFQFHYLLPELTVLENVLMPARKTRSELKHKAFAMEILERFELTKHIDKLPGQLSGGQAQRVAVARAMVMKPRYLFADEPTGSLDVNNAKVIMDIFDHLNQDMGTTIICVTHDQQFAKAATKNLELSDGKLL